MANALPAGEYELQFGDDYDDYDFDQEPFLTDLASFHNDVPFLEKEVKVKSNCFFDKSNESSIFLLSDLQNAVISGNITTLKSLIAERPEFCNSIMDSGWTPLVYASNFGHVLVVEALLEAGANVDLASTDGSTALMAACKCSRSEDTLLILQKLFDKQADPNLIDKNGKTALIYAVRSGKYEVVELVLKNSQSILNHKDRKGWTALDWAIMKEFSDIILLLIEHGANVYDSSSESISSLPSNVIESLQSLSPNSNGLVVDSSSTDDCRFHNAPIHDSVVNGSPKNSRENHEDNERKCAFQNPPDLTQHLQSYAVQNIINSTASLEPTLTQLSQQHLPNLDEDIITIGACNAGDGYQRYGQLELLLCGLNLSHLIPKFHEHDFQFEQLLCASNDDLIALGLNQVGVRNRILNAVKEWHTTEWQEKSLPDFSSTALTFANLQALLRTSSEHLLYIGSALRYAKNQLRTYPQVMNPPANMQLERNPDEVIITQVEDVLLATHQLCKSLKSLHGVVNGIKQKSSEQHHQADFVKRQKRPYSRKTNIIIVSLPLLASIAFLVCRYRCSW